MQMTELVHVSDVGVLALSALTHLSRLLLDVPVGVRVVTLQVSNGVNHQLLASHAFGTSGKKAVKYHQYQKHGDRSVAAGQHVGHMPASVHMHKTCGITELYAGPVASGKPTKQVPHALGNVTCDMYVCWKDCCSAVVQLPEPHVLPLQEMLPSLSGLLELDLRCVAWDDAATATLCQLPVLQAFKVRE